MTDLNFNIHAFTNPRTKAEYLSLVQEAVREMQNIVDMIKARGHQLDAHFASEQATH